MTKNSHENGVTNMDQRTCSNCKQMYSYYDGEVDGVQYYDLYCEKHKKWVYEDETCDDWEKG